MKILMFALEYPPIIGGGGSYVENLCTELALQGVEVRLITSGEYDSVLEALPHFTIVRSRSLFNLYNGNGNHILALDQLINEINLFKPDLVHTHHSLEKILFHMINLNFKLPHVSTHHKTPEFRTGGRIYGGKWAQYDFSNSLKCSLYISSSKVFKNDLVSAGIKSKNIKLIYPGVNPKIFRKVDTWSLDFTLSESDILIFIPSVVRERKGLEFALNSIAKLEIPNKKIVVVISGLSKIKDESKIQKLRSLVIPHELVRTKDISNQQMLELYSRANVVVLGTQGEGLGLSILESMSCNCPVVSTDVFGVNEIVRNNYNGLLSKYDDIEKFSENIKTIIENDSLRLKIIKNAKKVLNKKFSLLNQAKEHIKSYSDLISPL